MLEEERILAIDFGLRRIGLALTDPLLTFAYPYETIFNDSSLWKNLDKVVKGKNVKKIILGYPLKENKTETDVTGEVLKFKEKLSIRYSVQIILWDETYSSQLAKEIVIKSVKKKSKRRDKGLLDQNSAAIILQEYLNENK
jgi:putative pre-16S rRNA nuclease